MACGVRHFRVDIAMPRLFDKGLQDIRSEFDEESQGFSCAGLISVRFQYLADRTRSCKGFRIMEQPIPPRILAVDDDIEARLAVQLVLERQHMYVMLAESGEEGLNALSRAHFDLVITDLHMRPKNGLDLVQETRGHGIGVPFILLTAGSDLAICRVAAKMGVVAVLDKPVRKELLLSHVGEAISSGRLQTATLAFEFHPRCRPACSFSFGSFCPISTTDAPQ